MPDENVKADIIYLCSPNNPTGACYNKEQLEAWVSYALKNDAVILYDSAYEAFITDPTLPEVSMRSRVQRNVRSSSVPFLRQQDSQVHVSLTQLFRKSLCSRHQMEKH